MASLIATAPTSTPVREAGRDSPRVKSKEWCRNLHYSKKQCVRPATADDPIVIREDSATPGVRAGATSMGTAGDKESSTTVDTREEAGSGRQTSAGRDDETMDTDEGVSSHDEPTMVVERPRRIVHRPDKGGLGSILTPISPRVTT